MPYIVVPYIRVDVDAPEYFPTWADAEADAESMRYQGPETIFIVEAVEDPEGEAE
jgi:hypothetical protein